MVFHFKTFIVDNLLWDHLSSIVWTVTDVKTQCRIQVYENILSVPDSIECARKNHDTSASYAAR